MKKRFQLMALAVWVGLTLCGFARASGFESPRGSPRVTVLFDAQQMPTTERSVTIGRRIFVASGLNLFEVNKGWSGSYERVSIAEASATLADGQTAPAVFLGLAAHGHVLYATATAFDASGVPYASTLYRIEPGPRPGGVAKVSSAPFVGHTAPFMPNGMAVDRHGHVFVSNSFSATTGQAAVLKLQVTPEPFSFEESDWLSASDGGAFPNGIQLGRNTLYLASLSTVLQVPILRNGAAGTVSVLYNADPHA